MTAVAEQAYKFIYRTNYCVNYKILDKTTGEVILVNKSEACFTDYTSVGNQTKLDPNYKMEIYYELRYLDKLYEYQGFNFSAVETVPYAQVNEWYLKELRKLKLPVSYKEAAAKEIGYSKQDPECQMAVWTLDFAKYSSKAQVKFACHMIRLLFENSNYRVLQECFVFAKENPRVNLINMLTCLYVRFNEGDFGHGPPFGYMTVKRFISLKDLLKTYEDWKVRKYDNSEITRFVHEYGVKDNRAHLPSYRFRSLANITRGEKFTYRDYLSKLTNFINSQSKQL